MRSQHNRWLAKLYHYALKYKATVSMQSFVSMLLDLTAECASLNEPDLLLSLLLIHVGTYDILTLVHKEDIL